MLVYLNGRFVPAKQAVVSAFDRGFLYGDGLFETILVVNGRPFRWAQHLDRLQRGAKLLKIGLPETPAALRRLVQQLILKNRMPEALLRLTLTRGVGPPGYSPKQANRPTLVMSLHAAPFLNAGRRGRRQAAGSCAPAALALPQALSPRWRLITASPRLPAGEILAQFKTCNKLPQILARAQAEAAGADEALLLNTDGFVVEGAASNLFWIEKGTVCTSPLADGILAGVTREVVFELCGSLGVPIREGETTPNQLKQRRGVFLTLSSRGIVEAISLDGHPLPGSPVIGKLREAYWGLVRAETSR